MKTQPERLPRDSVMERIGMHPLYALLTTVSVVVAALLGVLYSTEIKNSPPLDWGDGATVSVHAAVFWVSFLVFGLSFFYRQQAMDHARRREQVDLMRHVRRLESATESLPDAAILSAFAAVLDPCHLAVTRIREERGAGVDDIKLGVRIVLNGVLALVRRFGGQPDQTGYAADVMLFEPMEGLNGSRVAGLRDRLRFLDPDADLGHLRGVLDLDVSLSTSTRSGLSGPDPDLRPLAIPIPREYLSADATRWRLLPGPAMAFAYQRLDAYTDTRTLGRWCETQGDFPYTVKADVERFFGQENGRKIRSLVSLGLKGTVDEAPIGVLNIYADRVGLLAEKRIATQFTALVRPFQHLLSELLIRCKTASAGAYENVPPLRAGVSVDSTDMHAGLATRSRTMGSPP